MSRREEGLKEKIKKEKVKKKDKNMKDEQEAFPTIQEWVSGEDTSSSSSDGSNNLFTILYSVSSLFTQVITNMPESI